MRKHYLKVLSTIMLSSIFISGCGVKQELYDDALNQISELNAEVESLSSVVESLSSELDMKEESQNNDEFPDEQDIENSNAEESKFIIFKKAMESPNEGINYEYVSYSIDHIKDVYNNAGYATDELRAFVDYFTFEDMSESSVDDIVSAYSGAIEKASKWNTVDQTGIWHFFDTFRNLNSVEESSDGHINIPDLNETAKELDISLSALEDYLNKLNEKGAGFVF